MNMIRRTISKCLARAYMDVLNDESGELENVDLGSVEFYCCAASSSARKAARDSFESAGVPIPRDAKISIESEEARYQMPVERFVAYAEKI